MIDALWRDTRSSARTLSRSPGHLATAVLCLSIGIVASASVFSIVNALFYRAMPGIEDRNALRRVNFIPSGRPSAAESATTADVRTLTTSPLRAASVASEGEINASAVVNGEPINVVAAFVSGGYFDTLGT